MFSSADCPGSAELEAWLNETLQYDRRATIEKHVSRCERCSAIAVELFERHPDGASQWPIRSQIDSPAQSTESKGSEPTSFELDDGPVKEFGRTIDASSLSERFDAELPSDADPFPRELEHYRLRGLIGEGGMGRVFVADDTLLHREVAIKMLLRGRAADELNCQRFLDEARAVAALHHELIVPIYHVGIFEGQPYFVMPRLIGESLQQRLKQGRELSLSLILQITREITTGLSVVHQAGMIHRDIKPANVFLRSDEDRVCLLDFGIAKDSRQSQSLTATGSPIGTPQYMSPEQARGDQVTPASDLFSLGVTLYELLSGQSPFLRDSALATLNSITNDSLPPLPFDDPPRQGLLKICRELTHKNASQRPGSADEVFDQLLAIAEETGPHFVRSSVVHPQQSNATGLAPNWRPFATVGAVALAAALIIVASVNEPGQGFHAKSEAVESKSARPTPFSVQLPDYSFERAFASYPELATMPQPGQPMAVNASVGRPTMIPGLRSWSIEMSAPYDHVLQILPRPGHPAFATMGNGSFIRLWNENGELQEMLMGHVGPCNQTHCFSPCGRYLVTKGGEIRNGTADGVRIWDIDQHRCLLHVDLGKIPSCLAWSPNGRMLAFDDQWGKIVLLSLEDGRRSVIEGEALPTGRFAWSKDSRFLVSKSSDGPAIFDTSTGRLVNVLRPDVSEDEEWISHFVSFSADGSLLAGYAGSLVFLWDFDSRDFLRRINTNVPVITSLNWHPWRNEFAVSGVTEKGADSSIAERYSAETGTLLQSLDGIDFRPSELNFPATLAPVAYSSDGDRLIGSDYKRIFTFPVQQDSPEFTPSESIGQHFRISSIPFSGGRRMNSNWRFFDLETGSLSRHHISAAEDPLGGDPQGRWFSSESDEQLYIVAAEQPTRTLAKWPVRQRSIYHRVSNDGNRLLRLSGKEVTIYPIDQALGTDQRDFAPEPITISTPAPIWSAEFSSDGRRIAILTADQIIYIHESMTGAVIASKHFLELDQEYRFGLTRGTSMMAWTDNDRSIVTGFGGNVVQIDTESWATTLIASLGEVPIRSVSVSPDEEKMVVGGDDWLMRLFTPDRVICRDDTKIGDRIFWTSDSQYFFAAGVRQGLPSHGIRFFDANTGESAGTLFPQISDNHWLAIDASGHYRGSSGVESHFFYVAVDEQGVNHTLSPSEFSARYGWQNQPGRVRLPSGGGDPDVAPVSGTNDVRKSAPSRVPSKETP